MFQLAPVSAQNFTRVGSATAVYIAARPTALMLQATVNLALVPAYSSDPIIQGDNSEFLPLTMPLIYGYLEWARYGYTVELADNNGNTEILPCWGIHYTPYFHLYWALPPIPVDGQGVIVFDGRYYPILSATFKYSVYDSFVNAAQAALANVSDVTKIPLIDPLSSQFNLSTDAAYTHATTDLEVVRNFDQYFHARLPDAVIGFIFNDNALTSPVKIHYTVDGTAPTLASPFIAPGDGLNFPNPSTLKFAGLRPVEPTYQATFQLQSPGYSPPGTVTPITMPLDISTTYTMLAAYDQADLDSYGLLWITNNAPTGAVGNLYYTFGGAIPTSTSRVILPGQTFRMVDMRAEYWLQEYTAIGGTAIGDKIVLTGMPVVDEKRQLANSILIRFLPASPPLAFTLVINDGVDSVPLTDAHYADIAEGLKVGRNSLNFSHVASVKVYNERRIWQKFTSIITILPTYPATGQFDARLRQAVFLEMTDDTHCLIDAMLTPELVNPLFEAQFPKGLTPPDPNTPIWIWKTNEPTPPIPWLVVAMRAEGDIPDDRAYYVPDGEEWYDDPMFGGTKVPIRDGQPYVNQNTTGSPPMVNIGSHQAVPLTNGVATVTFPNAVGDTIGYSSIAAYLWSCDSDLATFNNAAIQHPTLTITQAGWYEVTLKLTDSQDNIGYGFRYVYVYDLSQPPPKFIGNPSFRSSGNGWGTSLTLPANEVVELRDNAFVIAWRRSWFNGVEGTPIGEKIIFCGYITTGSIKLNPAANEITFEAATIDEIMKSIPVQAWAVQPKADYASWEILPQIRLKRLFYYGLKWFSNALEVTDFYLDPLPTHLPDFAVEPSDLFSVSQQIAQKFYGNFITDQAGRVFVYRDAQMLADSERAALPVITNILYLLHLVDQIEFTRNPTNQTRQVIVCGDVYDGDSLSSVGAAVPYPTPSSSGGKMEKYDRVAVPGQAEAAILAARFYALANMKIKELRAKFSADWSGLLSPAWRNWFTMSIPSSETGGLFAWNNQKLRVKSTTLNYDSTNGLLSCEAVFEAEATTMVVAQNYDGCVTTIPPAQENGINVPPSPPTADDQTPELKNPPKLCPLKCYESVPVDYGPDSCQYAKITKGDIYVIGDTAYRDTTWRCGEASATVTEQWPLADCEKVVSYSVTFTNQGGQGFIGVVGVTLVGGQTITGSATESISQEVIGNSIMANNFTMTVSGTYNYTIAGQVRATTATISITGLEIIPPA